MAMVFNWLLDRLTSRSVRSNRKRQIRRARPLFDELESRTLLATFTVNSTADGFDSNSADGICNVATSPSDPPECTLRAAIEQSNTLGNPSDQDTIVFKFSSP